jgi:hypothetical protein
MHYLLVLAFLATDDGRFSSFCQWYDGEYKNHHNAVSTGNEPFWQWQVTH